MTIQICSLEAAVERAISLTHSTEPRVIIGLVGKPGSGKSTLSNHLLKKLPKETTALVPMDGYHLSNSQLAYLGRAERKGAPDTFDSSGYSNLLHRIKTTTNENIYFPKYHREIEEAIAADGVVYPHTSLIITEGNYLLLGSDGWSQIIGMLTESWFIETDHDKRMSRLVSRHVKFGKSPSDAHAWANGTDARNAELIETTRDKADVIINLD